MLKFLGQNLILYRKSAVFACLAFAILFLLMAHQVSAQPTCPVVGPPPDPPNPMQSVDMCCWEAVGQDYECWGRDWGGDGNVEGNFRVRAFDPDGDPVYFQIDWDHDPPIALERTPPWPGDVPSGTWHEISHDFPDIPRQYMISAIACDNPPDPPPPDPDDGVCSDTAGNTNTLIVGEIKSVNKNADPYAVLGSTINYSITVKIGDQPLRFLYVEEVFSGGEWSAGSISLVPGSVAGGCPSVGSAPTVTVDSAADKISWFFDEITEDVTANDLCVFTFQMQVDSPFLSPTYTLTNEARAEALNAPPVLDTADVLVLTGDPWFQTFWGDIHVDGNIGQTEYNGEPTAEYVITVEGIMSGVTAGEAAYDDYSNLESVFGPVTPPLAGGVHNDSDWEKALDDPGDPISLWDDPADPSSNNIWDAGNLTIANNAVPIYVSRAGTVVVNGDLYIGGNMYYADYSGGDVTSFGRLGLPSLGFIVTGDVIVDPDVTHIVGSYYLGEGTFFTGSNSSGIHDDEVLRIDGNVYANHFSLERDLVYLNYPPSEEFWYDGRVLVNPPPGFEEPAILLPTWRRIEVP